MEVKTSSSPFGARTRTRVLLALRLMDESYPRELARLLDAPLSGVQKALASLERDGLVATRSVGRTRAVRIEPRFFAFDALPRLAFYVEFPHGPLAVGHDYRIRPVERRGANGRRALMLSATDSCRDRLAAFYHWTDRSSLEVAVAIALRNRIRLAAVQRWSIEEGFAHGFEEFLREVRRRRAAHRRRRA